MQKHESASSARQLLLQRKTRAATPPTKLPEGKDEDAVEGTVSLDRVTSSRPPVQHMQLLRANSSTLPTPQSPAPYSYRRKNLVSVAHLHQTHKRNLFVSHKDPQEAVDEASLPEEDTVLRQVRRLELAEASVTSYKKKTEQACGLHQDKGLQIGWPNVNVGSRVFSFFLGRRA